MLRSKGERLLYHGGLESMAVVDAVPSELPASRLTPPTL